MTDSPSGLPPFPRLPPEQFQGIIQTPAGKRFQWSYTYKLVDPLTGREVTPTEPQRHTVHQIDHAEKQQAIYQEVQGIFQAAAPTGRLTSTLYMNDFHGAWITSPDTPDGRRYVEGYQAWTDRPVENVKARMVQSMQKIDTIIRASEPLRSLTVSPLGDAAVAEQPAAAESTPNLQRLQSSIREERENYSRDAQQYLKEIQTLTSHLEKTGEQTSHLINSLTRNRDELTAALLRERDLGIRLATLEGRLLPLAERNESLEAEIAFVRSELRGNQTEILRLRDDLSAQEKQIKSLTEQKQMNLTQIDHLQERLQAMETHGRSQEGVIAQLRGDLQSEQIGRDAIKLSIERLTQRAETAESSLNSDRATISGLNTRLERADREIERVSADLNVSLKQQEVQLQAIAEKSDQISDLRLELSQAQGENGILRARIDHLESQLKTSERGSAAKESTIAELRSNLERSDGEIANLRRSLLESEAHLQQFQQETQTHARSLETQIDELRRRLDLAQADNSTLRQSVASLEQRSAVAETASSAKDSTILDLQSRLRASDDDISRLRGSLLDRETQFHQLQLEMHNQSLAQEKQITDLRVTLSDAQGENRVLNTRIDLLQARAETAEGALGDKERLIAELRSQLQESDGNISHLSRTLDDSQQQYQRQLLEMEGRVRSQDETINGLRRELSTSIASSAELRQSISALQERAITAEASSAAKEVRIVDLTARLEASDANIVRLTRALQDTEARYQHDLEQARIQLSTSAAELDNALAAKQRSDELVGSLRSDLLSKIQDISRLMGESVAAQELARIRAGTLQNRQIQLIHLSDQLINVNNKLVKLTNAADAGRSELIASIQRLRLEVAKENPQASAESELNTSLKQLEAENIRLFEQLQAHVQTREDTQQKLQETIGQLQAKLQKTSAERDEALSALAETHDQLGRVSKEKEDVIAQLGDKLSAANQDLSGLKLKIDEARATYENLRKLKSELVGAQGAFASQIQALTGELRKRETRLTDQIRDQKTLIDSLEAELNESRRNALSLSSELRSERLVLADLRGTLDVQKAELTQKRAQIDLLTDQLIGLQTDSHAERERFFSEISSLRERLALAIDTGNTNAASIQDEYERKISKLTLQYTQRQLEASTENRRLQQELDSLSKTHDQLIIDHEMTTRELASARAEISGLKATLSSKDAEIAALKKAQEQSADAILNLSGTLTDLKTTAQGERTQHAEQVTQLQSELSSSIAGNEAVSLENRALQDRIRVLETQLSQRTEELASSVAAQTALLSENAALKEDALRLKGAVASAAAMLASARDEFSVALVAKEQELEVLQNKVEAERLEKTEMQYFYDQYIDHLITTHEKQLEDLTLAFDALHTEQTHEIQTFHEGERFRLQEEARAEIEVLKGTLIFISEDKDAKIEKKRARIQELKAFIQEQKRDLSGTGAILLRKQFSIKFLETEVASLTKQVEALQLDSQRLLELEAQLYALNGSNTALKTKLEQLEHEKGQDTNTISRLERSLKSSQERLQNANEIAAKFKTLLEQVQLEGKDQATRLESSLTEARAALEKLELQDRENKSRIIDLEAKLQGTTIQLTASKRHCDALFEELSSTKTESSSLQAALQIASRQVMDKDREIATLRAEIQNMRQASSFDAKLITNLRAQIEQAQDNTVKADQRADALRQENHEIREILIVHEQTISLLKGEIETLNHSVERKDNLISRLKNLNSELIREIQELKSNNDGLKTRLMQSDEGQQSLRAANAAMLASHQEKEAELNAQLLASEETRNTLIAKLAEGQKTAQTLSTRIKELEGELLLSQTKVSDTVRLSSDTQRMLQEEISHLKLSLKQQTDLVDTLRGRLSDETKKFDEQNVLLFQLQQKNESLIADLRDLKAVHSDTVHALEAELSEKSDTISRLQMELDKKTQEGLKQARTIESLELDRNELGVKKEIIAKLEGQLKKAEAKERAAQHTIHDRQSEIDQLREDLNRLLGRLKSLIPGTTPRGGDIGAVADKIEAEIREKNQLIEELQKDLSQARISLSQAGSHIANLNETLTEQSKSFESFLRSLARKIGLAPIEVGPAQIFPFEQFEQAIGERINGLLTLLNTAQEKREQSLAKLQQHDVINLAEMQKLMSQQASVSGSSDIQDELDRIEMLHRGVDILLERSHQLQSTCADLQEQIHQKTQTTAVLKLSDDLIGDFQKLQVMADKAQLQKSAESRLHVTSVRNALYGVSTGRIGLFYPQYQELMGTLATNRLDFPKMFYKIQFSLRGSFDRLKFGKSVDPTEYYKILLMIKLVYDEMQKPGEKIPIAPAALAEFEAMGRACIRQLHTLLAPFQPKEVKSAAQA